MCNLSWTPPPTLRDHTSPWTTLEISLKTFVCYPVNMMCSKSNQIKMLSYLLLIRWQYHIAKPHSGVIVLMLSYLLPIRWQHHTAKPHSGVIVFMSYLLPIRWQDHTAKPHSGVIVLMLSYLLPSGGNITLLIHIQE